MPLRKPQSPLSDSANAIAAADANLWRRAFHLEASECIGELQAVFGNANVVHFASRFDEWRKIDLKATAQMQSHVKQLAQLNSAIEEFLLKCATPDEFANFKGSMIAMTKCVDELTVTRTEIGASVDAIAERAASKVMGAWDAEIRASSDLLREHVETQRRHWEHEDKRGADITKRLDQFRACVEQLCGEVQMQGERVRSLEAAQGRATDEGASAFRNAVMEIRNLTTTSATQLTDSFREEAGRNLEAFKAYMRGVLLGGEGENSGIQPVALVLGDIDRRMEEWESSTVKEAKSWRENATMLEGNLKENAREREELRFSAERMRDHTKQLDEQIQDLRRELKQMEDALDAARAVSVANGMKRVKEIESRGNVKVNRQNGAVTLVRQIEFVMPSSPNQQHPAAVFMDPTSAASALTDVAEISSIFDVQVEVGVQAKLPKGASQAVWEQLTSDRADLVKAQLVGAGAVAENVSTKGVAGSAVADAMLIQLEKAIFADPPSKKRGASPAKRGR